ncbi:MAG: hypothetical protein KKD92_04550 [Proteobacteria bacterium]|nr:hypothetical protein [Pseudomonadota bacterium]OQX00249.1 MAG: hypothetical protein BWK74_00100 [Desulfobacteraceae bacterium A6]
MSTPTTCTDCISIMNFPTIGFGADFERLSRFYDQIVREVKKSATLGRQEETLHSLYELFEECSDEGWDGYNALPISEEAYLETRKLIQSLPITSFIPMPELTPEPNGDIALEWRNGSRNIFVASVRGRNEITYAGLFGLNKTHGTEYFNDTLPAALLENLKRLYL